MLHASANRISTKICMNPNKKKTYVLIEMRSKWFNENRQTDLVCLSHLVVGSHLTCSFLHTLIKHEYWRRFLMKLTNQSKGAADGAPRPPADYWMPDNLRTVGILATIPASLVSSFKKFHHFCNVRVAPIFFKSSQAFYPIFLNTHVQAYFALFHLFLIIFFFPHEINNKRWKLRFSKTSPILTKIRISKKPSIVLHPQNKL